MRKFQYAKEAFIATSLIVGITILISSLPLKNEFLKGLRQDVNGFDIYDMTFTDDNKKRVRDTNIVIVEIGNSRDEIAQQINIIEEYQPAVVAIDAYFEERRDSLSDNLLLETIARHRNLVFGSRVDTVIEKSSWWSSKTEFTYLGNFFEDESNREHSGYINFVGDDYSVVRTYPPFVQVNNKEVPAFTSKIIQKYSSEKFASLKKRDEAESVINYAGNIPDKYTSITKEELDQYHQSNQLAFLLKNKIVILGYFIKDGPLVLQDLHFSPLNSHIAGKAFPDMYGVVIHANILTMLINGKYATLASNTVSYLFAFLFTFLFLWWVIYLHSVKSHPSHARILLFQFIYILLVIYLFVQVFNLFLWKVPLSLIVISLVLCIELLGLYKVVAKWLHKRFGYITVFKEKHPI